MKSSNITKESKIDIQAIRRQGWEIEVDHNGDISYMSPRMEHFCNTWLHETQLTVEYLLESERKQVMMDLHIQAMRDYKKHLTEMLEVAVQPLQL